MTQSNRWYDRLIALVVAWIALSFVLRPAYPTLFNLITMGFLLLAVYLGYQVVRAVLVSKD